MILSVTIPIDFPSGGRLEIDVDLECVWCPAEGDGFQSWRIKEHWELDEYRVTVATWYHPDGALTSIKTPPGSIGHDWLGRFLDNHCELLGEPMEQALLTERI